MEIIPSLKVGVYCL